MFFDYFDYLVVGGLLAAQERPSSFPDPKNVIKKVHKMSHKIYCFIINEYLGHEFCHGTYLEMKISIGAFDCLNITSVSLLGCSFVPGQGP